MAESDCEEEVIQKHDLMIKTAESSPVKCQSPVVVFAHGAAAPSTSAWMTRWRNLLANALNAVEVVTFDYPFISTGRRSSPKPETLVEFHSDIVRNVAAKYPEHPLILVGKSMGSRVSCMVATENDIDASAVVSLGYPLKTSKGVIRDEPLLQLTVPIMFVQGGNDSYCPLKLLEMVRKKLHASSDLHVIENADHSFQIAKKKLKLTGMTREKVDECAVEAVAEFVSQITSEKVVNGPRVLQNTRGLSQRACTKGIQPWKVSRTVVCCEDNTADEQNGQHIKSQPKVKAFAKQKQATQIVRKRKSERIVKNKLKKCVYVEGGRGSTFDNPVYID